MPPNHDLRAQIIIGGLLQTYPYCSTLCTVLGGRLTGQVVRAVTKAFGSGLPVSLTSYSVVGAAAYMGGATRMTLTTTVMVMETTGSLQLIVPIMMTVFVAKVNPYPPHSLITIILEGALHSLITLVHEGTS